MLTGQRVTSIHHDESGVTLRTTSGAVRADKAIVSVPPPMSARIAYAPPLPRSRTSLEKNTCVGSVYKAIAVFERPFWREGTGHADFLFLDHPGAAVFDTTPPDGPGHLCILVAGAEAREVDRSDAAGRNQALLRRLVPHIGSEVLTPASWHEKSWHLDEHVGGGYAALATPGTTDGHLPMSSQPIGALHWAGTETASEHAGFIEGADESGVRAPLAK